MKVLIFGLDGATLDLIRPWAAEGKLPTLARLMAQGTWGPLESTIPPMTSPAWPSFATGKYPAKHGVFDFVSAHSGTFHIVNATDIQAPCLWDIASSYGQRVGIVNMPVTWPPHPVAGYMISGLLSPLTARVTWPADLLRPYERGSDRYRVMPTVQYKPGNEREFLADLAALIETRTRFAACLMRDHPVDLNIVHFLAIDMVQHAMWRHMDPDHPDHVPASPFQHAILDIYQRVDHAMAELLSYTDDETVVMVMSDHGFGPLHGLVNLNILLWEQGLLHLKRSPLSLLRTTAFRQGITPRLAYGWLNRLNLQNLVARVAKSTRNALYNQFLSFRDVDWSRTVAYSLGHMGQIYINLQGRETHGIVEPGAAYEQALDRVTTALQTLTLPDGRPMLAQVIRRSELPGGSHATSGPDLHIVLDGYRYISCPLFATDGRVLSQQIRGDSGSHRLYGTFIAAGPGIRTGALPAHPRIVDLTSTALYLLGCPIPADMDGRVLSEIMEDPFSRQHIPRAEVGACLLQPSLTLSGRQEADLEWRLRGLGYLG